METRVCKKCSVEKLLAEFPARGRDGRLHKSQCKACFALYMKAWKAADPRRGEYDRMKAKERAAKFPTESRKNNLKARHGITLERYNEMNANQNGVCAICSGTDKDIDRRTGKNRALAVDHCHETGVIRDLLCGDCNRALGLAKEDPEILRKMIAYLAKHHPTIRLVA